MPQFQRLNYFASNKILPYLPFNYCNEIKSIKRKEKIIKVLIMSSLLRSQPQALCIVELWFNDRPAKVVCCWKFCLIYAFMTIYCMYMQKFILAHIYAYIYKTVRAAANATQQKRIHTNVLLTKKLYVVALYIFIVEGFNLYHPNGGWMFLWVHPRKTKYLF